MSKKVIEIKLENAGADSPLFVVKNDNNEIVQEGHTVKEFVALMKSKDIDPNMVREILSSALGEEE